MTNLKLLAARQERGWSIEVASARVGVSRVTYSRWENGHQEPQPAVLTLLCNAYGKGAIELGYEHLSRDSVPTETREALTPAISPVYALTEEQYNAFTALIGQGEAIMFDPKKRETLRTLLGAMALTVGTPSGFFKSESWNVLFSQETTTVNYSSIQGLTKLIQACWHFCTGNELNLAEQVLSESMPKLVQLAEQPSQYQRLAANLAAQGYQISNILALHRNDLRAKEAFCKKAVVYSTLSGEQDLIATSLRQLADTYLYKRQYPLLLDTYTEALQHTKNATPLLQASIYQGLAMSYAYTGQRQEALTYQGLALDTFPDHPESDPSFAFADFDRPWMVLEEGMTRTTLGQAKQSLLVLDRIGQQNTVVPDRIKIEIVNHKANAAILSEDLDLSLALVKEGVIGSRSLGSQRRYNEAYDNYKQMLVFWPQEKGVKEIGELFYA